MERKKNNIYIRCINKLLDSSATNQVVVSQFTDVLIHKEQSRQNEIKNQI